MARNKEFDDALDELKMLHDAKNHDYATAGNPYKNLEGVSRIGIEPWRGIVIRLMDKFERVEQYCTNGELAIKSEGMEDTFKDIAVYSTLAMILFRKEQDDVYAKKTLSKDGYADWEQDGKPPLHVDKHGNVRTEPVDNLDARLEKTKKWAEKIIAKRTEEEDGDDATQELTEVERGKDAENDEDKFWAKEIESRQEDARKAVMKWRENGAIS